MIAIENTRLFEETKEALERQIATASVLSVISGSPTNVDPVFEAILENACRLCGSQLGAIFRYDGTLLHLVATKNWPVEALAGAGTRWPMLPDPRMTSGRAVLTKGVVLQQDTLADPTYDHSSARRGGWRRMLGVPMLRENNVIGVVVVTWHEPGPILPKQIELLKTFADQAVIAIENTRLFEAEQARTRELTESRLNIRRRPARCSASSVVGPQRVQPVFETIVTTASAALRSRLCRCLTSVGTMSSTLWPHQCFDELHQVSLAAPPCASATRALGRAVVDRRAIQIAGRAGRPAEYTQANRALARFRTALAVPLLREGEPIGIIRSLRTEVTPVHRASRSRW